LALGAASCATPSIDRYLLSAESGAQPARLKGSHGYLSHDQSRAILESLGRKSPDAGLSSAMRRSRKRCRAIR
jgi:hypothetical protein